MKRYRGGDAWVDEISNAFPFTSCSALAVDWVVARHTLAPHTSHLPCPLFPFCAPPTAQRALSETQEELQQQRREMTASFDVQLQRLEAKYKQQVDDAVQVSVGISRQGRKMAGGKVGRGVWRMEAKYEQQVGGAGRGGMAGAVGQQAFADGCLAELLHTASSAHTQAHTGCWLLLP